MAYPDPYTITDGVSTFTLIPVPASDNNNFEPDDRGGGKLPVIRAGVREKYSVETVLDEAVGGTYITLADCFTLMFSLDNWTLKDSAAVTLASGPVNVEVMGDGVQQARITVG